MTIALVLGGCAIQLAPSYDQQIAADLGQANRDALTLFAAIGSGTTAATFPVRERDYNAAIGEFDAVRLEVEARNNPNPSVAVPTDAAIKLILGNLTSLRNRDQASGVTADTATGRKQSYEISIDQALTYEQALKR